MTGLLLAFAGGLLAGVFAVRAFVRRAPTDFAQVLDALPDPVFVKDRAHRFLMVNEALCRFVGLPRAALIGKTDYDFFPKEQADVFREKDELVHASESENINEESLTDSSGRTKRLSTKKRSLVLADGARILVGTIRDITEQHQQALALERSERRMRLLMDNLPASIAKVEADGRYGYANRPFAEWMDKRPDEVVGRTIEEVIGADNYRNARQYTERALAGERVSFEREYVSPLGARSCYAFDLVPDRDADGKVVGYFALGMDITERKLREREARAAREAAEAAERRLRHAIEALEVGFVLYDTDDRLIACNEQYKRFYPGASDLMVPGARFEDIIRESVRSGIQPVAVGREEEWVRERLALHHSCAGSREQRLSTGRFLRSTERRTADGDIVGVRTDITEIREAQEVAEAASRAKSQFLATMSHEIRTPMNGVLGMTELLLGTRLDDKQRRFAQSIQRSGTNLLGIINDILDFSKIEAGRMELERIDFDLTEIVNDVLEVVQEQAQSKSLALACAIDTELPTRVAGDPLRIRQILTNLAGNAVKFTNSGSVAIEIAPAPAALLQAPIDGDESIGVQFRVTDTGVGMSSDALARVFNAFTQADGSTTRKFGGTGLGLVICKQLAEMMGGAVGVESDLGQGSSFWFTVRLAPPRAPAPSGEAPISGVRALIVEDNPTNRGILQYQLGTADMRIEAAEHGARALEILRAAARRGEPYQVALVDKKMPVMDGIELAHAVRSDPLLAALKIVVLTSADVPGEVAEARRAGVHAHLIKPVRQSELLRTIAEVLALAPSAARDAIAADVPVREPRSARLLLAEDNRVNREIAVNMLESLGYQVDCAVNGREAVARFEPGRYDLVLMDCQMPEMDGFEATTEIRRIAAEAARGHTPIIALTANAMQGDRERCLDAGMDDYLSKPFRKSQLREVLERWTRAAVE